MARSLTVEIGNPSCMGQFGERNIVTIDWKADSSGGVSGEIAAAFSAPIGEHWKTRPTQLTGTLHQVNTQPGLYGDLTTDLAAAGHDITIKDAHNTEITGGCLTNRSDVSGEMFTFANPVFLNSELTFKVVNAGDGGCGRTILIFQD